MSNTKKALSLLLAALALLAGGYRWGATAANNANAAAALVIEKANAAKVEAEIKRGAVASNALQLDLRDLSVDYQNLEKAFNAVKKRVPILAVRPAVSAGCAAGLGAGAASPLSPGDPGQPGLLTDGAVWMWNSALIGTDQPSGACGLAGQSDAACAAVSGVTVEDAWDNQSINAKQCAEDRKRHQHLIDFIKGVPD